MNVTLDGATAAASPDVDRHWALVSQYEHPEVVFRLQTENGWSSAEAQEVFSDTLRFLYLCGLRRGLAPTKRIDIGWHAFLLYTQDYEAFCERYFGHFLHHRPVPKLTKSIRTEASLPDTIAFAREVFGDLSSNWDFAGAADGVGDAKCSTSDCSPVACDHR